MPITDVVEALAVIRKAQIKRDKEFIGLHKMGWRLSRLADHFSISRSRAQQIRNRLKKNGKL